MDVIQDAKKRMEQAVTVLQGEMATIRAGRANPKLLDRVTVEAYGTAQPLQSVANVSAPDPRMLVISPWDPKMIGEIEKAIQKSDLGIHPTNDGKVVRLVMPDLTSERRAELVKTLHALGETCYVAMRNVRRDGMHQIKKLKEAGEYTEDDVRDDEKALQKTLDKAIEQADALIKAKEKEINTL